MDDDFSFYYFNFIITVTVIFWWCYLFLYFFRPPNFRLPWADFRENLVHDAVSRAP